MSKKPYEMTNEEKQTEAKPLIEEYWKLDMAIQNYNNRLRSMDSIADEEWMVLQKFLQWHQDIISRYEYILVSSKFVFLPDLEDLPNTFYRFKPNTTNE